MNKDNLYLSDEEVVEIIRKKDKEFFVELMRRYQDKLLRYAGNILGDDEKAKDVVQESFIKTYKNINGFNVDKKFSSWIYRIVHNESMNFLVKNKRIVKWNEEIEIDSGIDIEEELLVKELTEHTNSCLKNLPSIYSEPLELFYLEGKKYEEISDILRLPIGTVGTRINRAKLIMKRICQKEK